MPDNSPRPDPKATLKDRIERDRLAEAVGERPGSESNRFFALVAAAKAKAGR